MNTNHRPPCRLDKASGVPNFNIPLDEFKEYME
jgi:hypothetical protein